MNSELWLIEEIPNSDRLFYRVHDTRFNKKGYLGPAVFQERGEGEQKGMSTDWEKYSTATKTRNFKNPEVNSIVSLNTGLLRALKLQVIHAPISIHPLNRAHTNVRGVEDLEVGLKLLDLMCWEIKSEKATGYLR